MDWIKDAHPIIYAVAAIVIWWARTGIPAGWRYVKLAHTLYLALSEIAALAPVIRQIQGEVMPSGGTSLRTMLQAIHDRVDLMGARSRAMWDLTPAFGMYETDKHGRCLEANHAYCAMLQRTLEDLEGAGWELSIHPSMRSQVAKEWREAVAGERRFEMRGIRYMRPDGSDFYGDCRAKPLISDGELVGYLGVVTPSKERE